MQVKIASGSGSAGFAVIGTGLAMALPEQRWIGFVLIAIGLSIFVFDIRFDHGEIESGDRRLGKWLRSHSRPRMAALIGMVIFGLGFVGSATVYFWPQRLANPPDTLAPAATSATSSSSQEPWKRDLEDLYNSDFNLLSMPREWEIKTSGRSDDPVPITMKTRFRIYQDFNSGIDFVSIFIPIAHNVKIDDKVFRDAGCESELQLPIPGLIPDVQGLFIGVRTLTAISPEVGLIAEILTDGEIRQVRGASPNPRFFPNESVVFIVGAKPLPVLGQ